MTETQLKEIRQYLLTRKLPIDIVVELNDHFVTQIGELMQSENIDFDAAFQKVKDVWWEELHPYWKGGINLEDTSDFMRRSKKAIERANFIQALKLSALPTLLIFWSAFMLKAETFGYLTAGIIISLLVAMSFHYFYHYKDFKLAKKYPKYVLTLHQHSIFLLAVIIGPVIQVCSRILDQPEKYQKILRFEYVGYSVWGYIILFSSIFLIITAGFFSLIAQKKYLQQMQKVKPFLNYLS